MKPLIYMIVVIFFTSIVFSSIDIAISKTLPSVYINDPADDSLLETDNNWTGTNTFSNITVINVTGINVINQSDYWDDIDSYNTTQFENDNGLLHAVKSWWDSLYCELTGCTMEGDIDMDGNDIDNVNDLTANKINASTITADGGESVWIRSDSGKQYFGIEKDASIYYNGADMVFDSQEVGTGDFVFNNGKVGIGTDDPRRELEVSGNSADFAITQADGKYSVGLITTSSGEGNLALWDDVEEWDSENTEVWLTAIEGDNSWISNGGNFGVGTKSPDAKLEVAGTGKFDGDVSITGDGTIPNSPGAPGFFLGKSLTDENRRLEIVTGATTSYIDFTDVDNDYLGRIRYDVDTNKFRFYTNGSSAMAIDSSGKVGIGTDSPSDTLEVNGNVYLQDNDKILLGTGKDASIYYDGTDMVFDSQEVGTGDFVFNNGELVSDTLNLNNNEEHKITYETDGSYDDKIGINFGSKTSTGDRDDDSASMFFDTEGSLGSLYLEGRGASVYHTVTRDDLGGLALRLVQVNAQKPTDTAPTFLSMLGLRGEYSSQNNADVDLLGFMTKNITQHQWYNRFDFGVSEYGTFINPNQRDILSEARNSFYGGLQIIDDGLRTHNSGNAIIDGYIITNEEVVVRENGNERVKGSYGSNGGYLDISDSSNVVQARIRSYGIDGTQAYFDAGDVEINNGDLRVSGSLSLGSNTQTGLNNGDLNISNIYYDTLIAKSPIIMCSNEWCSVDLPKSKDKYYLKRGDNWCIEEITDKNGNKIKEKYLIKDNNNCIINIDKRKDLDEIINKTNRLREKKLCINNNHKYDGSCYEIKKVKTTYKDATNKVPIYNETTIEEKYICKKLNQTDLTTYVSNCTNKITEKKAEIIDYKYEFKENCNWKEEIGYYCNEKIFFNSEGVVT